MDHAGQVRSHGAQITAGRLRRIRQEATPQFLSGLHASFTCQGHNVLRQCWSGPTATTRNMGVTDATSCHTSEGAALAVVLASAAVALVQPASARNEPALAGATDPIDADAAVAEYFARDRVTDRTTDRRKDSRGMLDELIEEGVITERQADIIRERFQERASDKRRGNRRHRVLAHVFAKARKVFLDTVVISAEEMRAALDDGATVGEIAQRNGVIQNALVAALIHTADAALDELVANKRITEARAGEIQDEINDRAEQFVERMWDRSGDWPHDRQRDGTAHDQA